MAILEVQVVHFWWGYVVQKSELQKPWAKMRRNGANASKQYFKWSSSGSEIAPHQTYTPYHHKPLTTPEKPYFSLQHISSPPHPTLIPKNCIISCH